MIDKCVSQKLIKPSGGNVLIQKIRRALNGPDVLPV